MESTTDRRRLLAGAGLTGIALALGACGREEPAAGSGEPMSGGEAIPLRHARYLRLERHPGFVVARLRAPVADQSGGQAQEQSAVVVMAPRDGPEPVLDGDLRDAVVIRTPVMRVAVNAGPDESFLAQLGVKDRLVAVGGLVSYDDDIRNRVVSGQIKQIGYNWHSPPNLDVLVALDPDAFLMRLSDLSQTPALDRARALGVKVVPTFAEDEPTYMGRAEWIRLHGVLTGRDAEAERLFREIEAAVEALKTAVAALPKTPVLWAYPAGGDRWIATVRGSENAYLVDAGGENLMARAENPAQYSSETVSSEALLPFADRADVWIIGDIHAVAPRNPAIERSFRAWRDSRLFGTTQRINPQANAYDWYQTGVVRPDWVLSDFVKALHPEMVEAPFRFLEPLAKGQYQ
jgi:iron complex transport system substrate-binding protein